MISHWGMLTGGKSNDSIVEGGEYWDTSMLVKKDDTVYFGPKGDLMKDFESGDKLFSKLEVLNVDRPWEFGFKEKMETEYIGETDSSPKKIKEDLLEPSLIWKPAGYIFIDVLNLKQCMDNYMAVASLIYDKDCILIVPNEEAKHKAFQWIKKAYPTRNSIESASSINWLERIWVSETPNDTDLGMFSGDMVEKEAKRLGVDNYLIITPCLDTERQPLGARWVKVGYNDNLMKIINDVVFMVKYEVMKATNNYF